jgi:hypothetical protein
VARSVRRIAVIVDDAVSIRDLDGPVLDRRAVEHL